MSTNPLFPNNPVRPTPADSAAVEIIRAKVAHAYGEEPSAIEQMQEAARERTPSKHQQFMQTLSQSGVSLAEVQTRWHHYYTQLPDAEKREVWEEFYAANQHTPYQKLFQKQVPVTSRINVQPQTQTATSVTNSLEAASSLVTTDSGITVGDHTAAPVAVAPSPKPQKLRQKRVSTKAKALVRKTKVGRKIADSEKTAKALKIKRNIQHKVSAGGKLQAKHHVQSLLFGLGMGGAVVLILLFGFFNEYVVAPFIQPSRTVGNIPVIASNISADQAADPTVIVPAINVQLPVDFSIKTTAENDIEDSLNNGVVHYASTVYPGQNGNVALFGHSSQNIFNNGKAKFAFVALHLVKTGDVFYITYQGKVYAYQVFAREIVPPTQVSVLNDTKGEQATAVLITCDPPGFSTNRLVVWGKQISPSVASNTASQPAVADPVQLTSNGPTLWTRMWRGVQFWR